MDSSSNRLEITELPLDRVYPNPWNPNRMPKQLMKKLAREIKERGFASPVLVRPAQDNSYQIVDGEHRYRAAKELGLKTLPCIIAKLDDPEAMTKTLQMNGFRGENEPEMLADLLSSLANAVSEKELAERLPYSSQEIKSLIELGSGFDEEFLAKKAQKEDCFIAPPELEVFAVVVSGRCRHTIERAMAKAADMSGCGDSADALERICLYYLGEINEDGQDK